MDRKLDLDKLKDKKHTVKSSEEALKDVEPWYLQINNQQVKEYYDHLLRIYNNTDIPKEKRIEALYKSEVVTHMVLTYEYGEEFDPEGDLRISYGQHLLPEEIKEIFKNIKEIKDWRV